MLNPLRRLADRDRIRPDPRMSAYRAPHDVEPIDEGPPDDYLVENDEEPIRAPAGARIVQGLQVLLILILAVLSLAVFWMVGLVLNIF
jgi:hypothetical protein